MLENYNKTKKEHIKNILVINTGYFGDVLLTSKLTRDIKNECPESKVIFIVDTPYESVVKGMTGVDEIFCYDRKKCQNILGFLEFWLKFPYKFKIDYTFIAHGRKTNRKLLAESLGSKKIFILPKFKMSKELLNLRMQNPLFERYTCDVANMLSALNSKLTDAEDIEYIVPQEAEEKINQYLNNLNCNEDLIAINPQAGDDWKCWDVNEVVKFVEMMIQDGKKVVLTGLLKDGYKYVDALNEKIGANNYFNFMDKTSIPELGALYKHCKAVISVDTGSMHMGCAVGTPTIALFFRDNYHYWGPYNLEKNSYIYNPDKISAQAVYDKLQKVMNKEYQTV